MGHGQKFQQQWQFKKRDNGHLGSQIDSPHEEWESNSTATLVFKKLKSVSDWQSYRTDEVCDFNLSQSEVRDFPANFEKSKKLSWNNGNSDQGIGLISEGSPKKMSNDFDTKNKDAHEPATLDNTRVFMESILAELKIARENLFVWMREEMIKVMGDSGLKQQVKEKNKLQHQSVQNCNPERTPGSMKSKRILDSQIDHKIPGISFDSDQIQFDYCQIKEASGITVPESGSKRLEAMDFTEHRREGIQSVLQESNFSIDPNHLSSSTELSYLSQPTGSSEIHLNPSFDSVSGSTFRLRGGENIINGVDTGESNPVGNLHNPLGRSSSWISHEENFKKIVQNPAWNGKIQSRKQGSSMDCQDLSYNSSNLRSGFAIPIPNSHCGAMEIQSQVGVQNLTQVPNLLGSSGGSRPVGASHPLSELYVDNHLCNNLNFKQSGLQIPRNLNDGSHRGSILRELDILELNT